MIYQVRANLYFQYLDEAKDFYHDSELALEKSTSVNPDSPNAEYGTIEFIQNHHDENPTSPCLLTLHKTTAPNEG